MLMTVFLFQQAVFQGGSVEGGNCWALHKTKVRLPCVLKKCQGFESASETSTWHRPVQGDLPICSYQPEEKDCKWSFHKHGFKCWFKYIFHGWNEPSNLLNLRYVTYHIEWIIYVDISLSTDSRKNAIIERFHSILNPIPLNLRDRLCHPQRCRVC